MYTVPKTKGWRWFKAIWNRFFRSRGRKEENPRNYYSLRVRERKNTFYITLNQRQRLTFGTVPCTHKAYEIHAYGVLY
jgi:hypothetical protein